MLEKTRIISPYLSAVLVNQPAAVSYYRLGHCHVYIYRERVVARVSR